MPGPSFQTRLLACLTLLALILTTTPAAADTWIVHPGESIQAAIDQAASGDTILIMPGQYQEHLSIQDKQLTVLGISPDLTTLQLATPPASGDSHFVVRGQAASGTTISGLTVRAATSTFGAGIGLETDAVIDTCVFELQHAPVAPLQVSAGVNAEVRNSQFARIARGIQNQGSLRLRGCQFSDCLEVIGTTQGISVCPPDSAVRIEQCILTNCTVILQSGESAVIEDSVLFRCQALLDRLDCASVQIHRCSILEVLPGRTFLRTSGDVHISGSLFARIQAGSLIQVYNGGTLHISDSTFSDNAVQQMILGDDVSEASIRGCTFRHTSYGTPLRIASTTGPVDFTDCTLIDNTFTLGVTLSSPQSTIARCTFDGNTVTGGLARLLGSNGPVVQCTFVENKGGPLLYCPRAEECTFERNMFSGTTLSHLTFDRCKLLGNTGTLPAGLTLIDSIIVGNTEVFSYSNLIGCTFIHNTGPCRIQPSTGSIIRNNVSPLGEPCGVRTASYSNTQGFVSGPGNIDADPLFIRNPHPGPDNTWGTPDDDYGDLRLQPGSPCIDAADSTAFPEDITTDLAGNPRFTDDPNTPDTGLPDPANQRAVADMGAYEYQPGAPHPLPCDHNADDTVDQVDLLLYLNLWFHATPTADLNTDGAVDVFDLLAFLDCFFAND